MGTNEAAGASDEDERLFGGHDDRDSEGKVGSSGGDFQESMTPPADDKAPASESRCARWEIYDAHYLIAKVAKAQG
jgi:hypothetical protein